MIDDVVAPVFHSNEPVAVVERIDEPQELTTVTTGAAGVALGAAITELSALVQPFTVCVAV